MKSKALILSILLVLASPFARADFLMGLSSDLGTSCTNRSSASGVIGIPLQANNVSSSLGISVLQYDKNLQKFVQKNQIVSMDSAVDQYTLRVDTTKLLEGWANIDISICQLGALCSIGSSSGMLSYYIMVANGSAVAQSGDAFSLEKGIIAAPSPSPTPVPSPSPLPSPSPAPAHCKGKNCR